MRENRVPASNIAGLAIFVALLTLGGCSDSGPKLYPVQGKVTLKDGTPIVFGHVIIQADQKEGNMSLEVCQGTINNGSYTIMRGAQPGAPLGKYVVAIQAAKDVDPANPYFTEWLADEKYIDPTKSKLTLEVIEKPEAGRYDFQLDPHPGQRR